jgi:hypothetical protein
VRPEHRQEMSLDDFKRGYDAGADAYREKAGPWPYWIVFLLALVLTEAARRHFGLRWNSSLGVMILLVFLLSSRVTVSKKIFWKLSSQ